MPPAQRSPHHSLHSPQRWLATALALLLCSRWPEAAASLVPRSSGTFRSLPSEGVLFTEDLLWETAAVSLTHCGATCLGHGQCLTFTFTPAARGAEGGCRLHQKRHTAAPAPGQGLARTGARSFSLVATDWIRKPCNSSADCTEHTSACFAGTCLCSHGYFFDPYFNTCAQNCTRGLGNGYLKYRGWDLHGHDWYQSLPTRDPTSTCLANCTATPHCVVISYYLGNLVCYHKRSTAQDFPSSWKADPSVIAYQRTCA